VTIWGEGDPRLKTRNIVHWRAAPAADPQALRLLLLGSSINYRGHEKVIRYMHGKKEYGVRGALNVPPTFMFDIPQWNTYAWAVEGLRLYRPFGDWVGSLGPARQPREEVIASEADFAAFRKGRVLEKANAARRLNTESRRKELLVRARPLWGQIQVVREHRRGRPALREPLRARLAEEGVVVSANDLDWLVRTLNKEEKGAGHAAGAPAASA
jgi:hypothetical protein